MDSINHKPRKKQHPIFIHTRTLDVARARRYFAELEALACEARQTRDPRVLVDALRVLTMQPANVRELLGV